MTQTTHNVRIAGDRVVKHYRSWHDGEPEREWAALTLLDRAAPGLAPRPLERRTEAGCPIVVMSRVPGQPLGAAPLPPIQVAALGTALGRLFAAASAEDLDAGRLNFWDPTRLPRLGVAVALRRVPLFAGAGAPADGAMAAPRLFRLELSLRKCGVCWCRGRMFGALGRRGGPVGVRRSLLIASFAHGAQVVHLAHRCLTTRT